jgi:hypothetical protein
MPINETKKSAQKIWLRLARNGSGLFCKNSRCPARKSARQVKTMDFVNQRTPHQNSISAQLHRQSHATASGNPASNDGARAGANGHGFGASSNSSDAFDFAPSATGGMTMGPRSSSSSNSTMRLLPAPTNSYEKAPLEKQQEYLRNSNETLHLSAQKRKNSASDDREERSLEPKNSKELEQQRQLRLIEEATVQFKSLCSNVRACFDVE